MGNATGIKICCHKGICTPQYEITFQEFEYKSRITPSPALHQDIFKSFTVEIDSQLSSMDTSRQLKLEQALIYAKKLKLRILSSSTLKRNVEFVINTLGYEGSRRGVKDGYTFVGVKGKVKSEDGSSSIINDIVFPIEDKELAQKHRGQHFCMYYDLSKDCYFIRDLSLGFGTFVKIIDILILKDNCLLHMGDHYFLININNECGESKLKVKVFGPPCVDKIYSFGSEQFIEARVKIGRSATCDIILDDSLASKVQATIGYINSKWVLNDGDGDKTSTNGVWLYLSEPLEIINGMVFKTNHTVLQAFTV